MINSSSFLVRAQVSNGGRTDDRKTLDRKDIWPKDIQPKRQKAERKMTERQIAYKNTRSSGHLAERTFD